MSTNRHWEHEYTADNWLAVAEFYNFEQCKQADPYEIIALYEKIAIRLYEISKSSTDRNTFIKDAIAYLEQNYE